jgi:hypothetical protein
MREEFTENETMKGHNGGFNFVPKMLGSLERVDAWIVILPLHFCVITSTPEYRHYLCNTNYC